MAPSTPESSRAGSQSPPQMLVYTSAILLRAFLFQFPALTGMLADRIEISTPVTSYKRLSEGVFLFTNGVPPYDGGVFHQAPLLLGLFYSIINHPRLVQSVFIAADVVLAMMLQQIMAIKQTLGPSAGSARRKDAALSTIGDLTVAALYLFNPFTLVSCLGRSTILFSNLAVVTGVWMGIRGNIALSMFGIAMASYLSVYPAMLVIPTIILLSIRAKSTEQEKKIALVSVGFFALWSAIFLLLSFVLVNSWDFLGSVYGTILMVSDLTPNLGLFWYFFIEMFDQFRPFFLFVFQIHVFIFALPISMKFRHHPVFVIFLLCAIMGTFKGYPAVGDASLYLSLLPLVSEVFPYMRYTFLIINLFLYSSSLAPIFWYLWVYVGSGNANFFYAIGLVYGIGEIILMIDTTFALLRRDFELDHPVEVGVESRGYDREVAQA